VRHPLLGAPLFEIFHDVQYLAIVWAFNLRRAGELRPILRGLFRPTSVSLFIYVGAVLAYGALGLAPLGDVWSGLLAASQLLHFYYDGFIWKLRDPATAAPLGVASAATKTASTGVRHAALWAGLAVAVAILGVAEAQGGRELRQRIPTLVELVPDNGLYHFYDAEIHWERGERQAALAGFRRSLALDPDYAPSKNNLALSLTELAEQASEPRPFVDELRQLRPTLDGEVAAHVDEELTRYR
jgi:hypothetical protein